MTELVKIVDSIRNSKPILGLLQAKGPVTLDHVSEGAQAFVAACVVRHHASRSCWILCPDVRRQEDLFNGLLNWEVDALFFPELELPAFEGALPDPEIVAERLEVLQQIAEGKRAVVVLTASSLEDQVPPAEALQKQSIALRRGDRLDRETLIETLIKSGYEQVSASDDSRPIRSTWRHSRCLLVAACCSCSNRALWRGYRFNQRV